MTLQRFFASCLAFVVLSGTAATATAVTSWDVHNNPQMFLGDRLVAGQTTNIIIAAPKINGVTVTFPTTTGGIIRIRNGSLFEDIYYPSATVNSTTKIITLPGPNLRNVCFNVAREIASCGDGLGWGKGAIVEVSNDAHLMNLKMNVDRANTLTASGGINFRRNGSGSLNVPIFSTAAIRDRQLLATNSKLACVEATNACYYRMGNAWISFGSGTTVNGGFSNAGKLQLANLSEIAARTMTGSTATPLALSPLHVTTNSGAGVFMSHLLRQSGAYLHPSALGPGVRNSSTVYKGDGTFGTFPDLTGSGTNLVGSADISGNTDVNSTTFADVDPGTLTFTRNVATGSLVTFLFTGNGNQTGGTPGIVYFNFRTSGGKVKSHANGINGFTYNTDVSDFSVSWTAKVLTGGLLTFRPMARVTAGAYRIPASEATFQVTIHEQ